MLLDPSRPHAFREVRTDPARADAAAEAACDDIRSRVRRASGLAAWAVHLAHDRTRVVTVEAWHDAAGYRADADARMPGAALYKRVGTGGIDPTPVTDPAAGVIVIDIFPVWRPLVRPVSKFNLRNGEAFNRQPGCVSTTVLRGITRGRIATYARWRTVTDFLTAFEATTGGRVAGTNDINAWAARKTFGLIRPDYHSYDLIDCGGNA